MHGERRRGRGRPRLLYWFRTPPGVKVGRAALDEEAIRLLEELNPEVEFDWTRILKGEGAESAPARPYRAEVRRGDRQRRADLHRPADLRRDQAHPVPVPRERAETEPAESPEPSASSPTAAHARLGSEGLSRLRARHAEVLRRVNERIPDEARREELKTLAERLNPDGWVTDDEVTRGLEEYEGVFESLRAVIGRRRRGKRRGGRGQAGPARESADVDVEPGSQPSAADVDGPEGEPDAEDTL
jgi:hypothetical protein